MTAVCPSRAPLLTAIGAIALALSLFGCGDHGSSDARPVTPHPVPTATPIRASQCPGHVDLHVNGPSVVLDLGYTGVTYDTRLHDGIVLTLAAACAGGSSECDTCTLTGPATKADARASRRCAADLRQACTTDADCATGHCVDVLGPPLGLIGGGTVSCVRDEIVGLGPGTFEPGTGSLTLPIALRWTFFEGLDVGVGCPRCTGSTFGAAGACQGGPHDGESCVVDATDDLVGNTSYDCPPNLSADIGVLNFSMTLTTGTSSLEPVEQCKSAGLSCYCPEQPVPDLCVGGRCDGDVGSAGTCSDGPLDGLCDHDFFRGCLSDDECTAPGDHCRKRLRECPAQDQPGVGNVGPLERDGVADPAAPTLVSTFCVPAADTDISNQGLGLPGPAAIRMPVTIQTFD